MVPNTTNLLIYIKTSLKLKHINIFLLHDHEKNVDVES
jgi:hypothetical protein